jgi:putative peptide zinc metalloprotease protein
MVALVALWGLVGMPILQLIKFFSVPGRWGTVNRGRAFVSASAIIALIAGIFFIPLPHHVRCCFYLQPQDAANVYVDVPGTLAQVHVFPESAVIAGQAIATFENVDLDRELTALQSKLASRREKFDAYTYAAKFDPTVNEELEIARREYETAASLLQQRMKDRALLTVNSPIDGYLIAPDWINKSTADSGSLETWYGHPLDKRNIGARMEASTLMGRVIPNMNPPK